MTSPQIPTQQQINEVIDLTYLLDENSGVDLQAQRLKVIELVERAQQSNCFSVCVRESMVSTAKNEIFKKNIKNLRVTSVIGFPNGNEFTTNEKIKLLEQARDDGADEFDMVLRYRDLISGNPQAVLDDLLAVSEAAGRQVLKVIFENAYLSKAQIMQASQLCLKAFEATLASDQHIFKNRFIKTSTGFAQSSIKGARLEDVLLMYQQTQGRLGIKPAGGIRDYVTACMFFEACGSPWLKNSGGGTPYKRIDPYLFRLGTSSLLDHVSGY